MGIGFALTAEQPTAEEIIAGRTTRGLTATLDAHIVDTLRNKPTCSLTGAERDKIASVVEKKPSIDLEINFEYNSDTIGAKAVPQVTALGQALSSTELKEGTLMVAGYTDAKGGDTFNQNLSERRADAVKCFLAEKYQIDATNLVTVGYGKTRLKDPSNPTPDRAADDLSQLKRNNSRHVRTNTWNGRRRWL